MSDVVHGLYITVLGMGLVFLTLGAIYLLMTLLVRFVRPKSTPAPAQPSSPTPDASANGDLQDEKVAAIAVALARALAEEPRPLAITGRDVSGWASRWVAAGRNRQLNHPQSREKRL